MSYSSVISFLLIYIISASTFASDITPYAKAEKLTGDISNGKKVFQLCASCHSDNAWGKKNGSFPVLAGQHKSVIIKQLHDIQDRNRQNPTMYPFSDAKSIGGAQNIADVAQYIEQLPAPSQHGIGPNKVLNNTASLYNNKCVNCHGAKGEGSAIAKFPKINNQHYSYLNRQLRWIRDGLRKNSNPIMLKEIKILSDKDLASLADYISRL